MRSVSTGQTTLPCEPPITYDLADRPDRARVYEQVLREGTEDDPRFDLDADHLLELWDELVLPPRVRQAWGVVDRRAPCGPEPVRLCRGQPPGEGFATFRV
jgi:hypothetical protein